MHNFQSQFSEILVVYPSHDQQEIIEQQKVEKPQINIIRTDELHKVKVIVARHGNFDTTRESDTNI
jgi:hypothetical protein